MTSVRESFVKLFGEKQATAIENAAQTHQNGLHDNQGTDPFKWAVVICIGYQCVENRDYAEYHGISIDFEAFKKWCKKHGKLDTHDGDCDYLGLMCGVYNEYMPAKTS